MFNIDILKYSTLPSLAYAIYRSNFMKKEFNIPLIDGSTYTDLKKAYTGGMVDVYKPTSLGKVFSYDVNSLYPFTMKRYPMPIGTPKYFTGDIFKINSDAFGIFEVEVVAPDNLFYPVLQTKVKSDNVNQTISPLGKWTGWYLSEELKNAMKFGYKFKVISGYLFDKKYIFNEYVDFLYNLKSTSVKGTPDYVISKLLMNSLYGKFGADPLMETHSVIDSNKSDEYNRKYIVTDEIDLKNGKELISFFKDSGQFDNHKLSQKILVSQLLWLLLLMLEFICLSLRGLRP